MGGRMGRLTLSALLAGLGCGSESLGGHAPAGAGGSGTNGSGGAGGDAAFGGSESGGSPGSGGEIGGSAGDVGNLGQGGTVGTAAGGAVGSGGSGGQFCGQVDSALGVSLPADVLILLDRSSSMNDDVNEVSCPGGCGASSKWAVLGAALDQIVNTNQTVNWGIAYYPTDASCGVSPTAEVDVGAGTGLAIAQSLAATTVASGGPPPTAQAISAASAYLQLRGDPSGGRYILLATDGHSGCAASASSDPDSDAIAAAMSAAGASVPTFVVGVVPASDTAATVTLNQIALAGGEPEPNGTNRFYTIGDLGPNFPPVLPVPSLCAVSLPHPLGAADLVVDVQNGGVATLVPEDPANGWSLSPAGDSITLNGSSCTGASVVQLNYVCALAPLGHRRAPGAP